MLAGLVLTSLTPSKCSSLTPGTTDSVGRCAASLSWTASSAKVQCCPQLAYGILRVDSNMLNSASAV